MNEERDKALTLWIGECIHEETVIKRMFNKEYHECLSCGRYAWDRANLRLPDFSPFSDGWQKLFRKVYVDQRFADSFEHFCGNKYEESWKGRMFVEWYLDNLDDLVYEYIQREPK